MADANQFVRAVKKAAKDEWEACKPVNVFFGQVQGVNPLKISVEQKMLLGESQLVLTRNVTDYESRVTVEWLTQEALQQPHSHQIQGPESNGLTAGAADLKHSHGISGEKTVRVHNALKAGEELVLIRQQGGQKFIVVDRIGGGR